MKRCVFCGTENDDSATECVKCHNQLPDRPDGEESRTYGFPEDPAADGQPVIYAADVTDARPDDAGEDAGRDAGISAAVRELADEPEQQPADAPEQSPAYVPEQASEGQPAGNLGQSPAYVTEQVPEGQPAAQAPEEPAHAAGQEGAAQADSEGQDKDAGLPENPAEGQTPAGAAEGQAPEGDVRIYGQTPAGAAGGQAPEGDVRIYGQTPQGEYGPADGQTPQGGYGPADGQTPQGWYGPADGQMPQGGYVPAGQEAYGDSFARQPEGTTSGRIPPRNEQGGDFGVGRGQTYGARQQVEARGGRYDGQTSDQYGSAGYGYRQGADGSAEAGRTDLARMNTAVGSKTILFRSRKMVKGFLFFLVTLSFTAMLVMTFWNCAVPGTMDKTMSNAQLDLNFYYDELARLTASTGGFGIQLLSELGMQVLQMITRIGDIIKSLGTSVQLSILLIIAVPNLFFALAQWIMFAQTKRKRTKFGMGGYTLARVMMILKLIVACLILAIGLIISVYFVVAGSRGTELSSNFIQGLIMLVTMIVVAIFTIMYYAQWIFTLKCMKVNVRSGVDIGRTPVYLGIISIIVALGAAGVTLPLPSNDFIGIGAGVSTAAYFLFSGLWVLIYHGFVKRASALKK